MRVSSREEELSLRTLIAEIIRNMERHGFVLDLICIIIPYWKYHANRERGKELAARVMAPYHEEARQR